MSDESLNKTFTFFSAEVSAVAVVVFFAAAVADFFVVDYLGFLACLADCPVVFVDPFVVAVVDFAAFFFYQFFPGYASLYVPPHLQIRVQLPVVLMKSIQQLPVLPE